MNDAIKLKKIEHRTAVAVARAEVVKELIRNPVVELVAAYVIIEYLQKEKIIPDMAGNVVEAAVVAAVGLQQLAPLAPYIAQSTEGLFKMVGSLGQAGLSTATGLAKVGL